MNDDSSIQRLAAILRSEVARLRPGDRLPSSRELVARHGVSPVTVSRALAVLAGEGRVVTRPGSGTFAATPPASLADTADLSWQTVSLGDRTVDESGVAALLARPPDGVIPLTGGYLNPNLIPAKALAAAAGRAVRRAETWLHPPLTGLSGLRRWFATEIGGDVTWQDVLIAAGGQAALAHCFRALAAPGQPVLVETPTYPGALAAAKAAGLRPVAVPIDHEGVRPDLLAETFAVTGARLFYCQPTLHNPTGATAPVERREQVLAVARAAGAFVIEDDYARHLALGPMPPPLVTLDAHGVVVYIHSLTKITSPSLRLAGLVARGPAAHRLRWSSSAPPRGGGTSPRSPPRSPPAATRSPGRSPGTCPTPPCTCSRAAACTCGYGCRATPTRPPSSRPPGRAACWSAPAASTTRRSRPAPGSGSPTSPPPR
jgi:DNA-binding transcriptional MocR family regulator